MDMTTASPPVASQGRPSKRFTPDYYHFDRHGRPTSTRYAFKGQAARDARERVKVPPAIDPATDDTIPLVAIREELYVADLMQAFFDLSIIRDSEKAVGRRLCDRQKEESYNAHEVEIACRCLFHAVMHQCCVGYRGQLPRDWPSDIVGCTAIEDAQEADWFSTCQVRVDNVIKALREWKSICVDIMSSNDQILSLAYHPVTTCAIARRREATSSLSRENDGVVLWTTASPSRAEPTSHDCTSPSGNETALFRIAIGMTDQHAVPSDARSGSKPVSVYPGGIASSISNGASPFGHQSTSHQGVSPAAQLFTPPISPALPPEPTYEPIRGPNDNQVWLSNLIDPALLNQPLSQHIDGIHHKCDLEVIDLTEFDGDWDNVDYTFSEAQTADKFHHGLNTGNKGGSDMIDASNACSETAGKRAKVDSVFGEEQKTDADNKGNGAAGDATSKEGAWSDFGLKMCL